jgi:ATP-binding cassette subfamily B protein
MSEVGIHEEEALGKAYDAKLMKRLMVYIKPYRWYVALAVVLLLLSAGFQTALAFITKKGIDENIMVGVKDGFLSIALIYLGIIFLNLIINFLQIYFTAWLGQKVQDNIRMEVFSHLQKLHLGFYDKNPVGRMVTRVTNDINTLNELFSSGVANIIGDILMLGFFIGALLYVNWKLACYTFISLPILIVATFVFRKKARDAYRSVRLRLARLNAFVQEHLTGITIVQLFNREKDTYNRFNEINTDLRGAHFRSVLYYAIFSPSVELIGAISVGILFYMGGIFINNQSLTLGELVLFIYLVERFFYPIRDLSEKYNVLQTSMASSERIFNLLDTKPGIVNKDQIVTPDKFKGKIDFENVWFAYKDDEWVLKDISFSVSAGEKVAIVGATGAGKTSLISLLYRFYDYQKGHIKVSDIDLRDYPVEAMRNHLGLVLQDVFIFSGDYARNVRLRDKNITDEDIKKALNRVGFDRFMVGDSDGIQTIVKERGATLSTGQKQLLSFARALAFNPDILILDEATSSVDTETELLIQKALDELLKDRTSIIIAHRLSTIEKADKIIVLHHGEVREIGNHEQLLNQKGIYYKLYQLQYKKSTLTKVANNA